MNRPDNTEIEKAPGACNTEGFEIDTTNDLNFATGQREANAFSSMAAQLALAGYGLARSNPADGPMSYWIERGGIAQCLPDLDAVRRMLQRIGRPV